MKVVSEHQYVTANNYANKVSVSVRLSVSPPVSGLVHESYTSANVVMFCLFTLHKRGLCCRPVSVRLSRWCIVSTRLKISSNFFLGLVAHHSRFFLHPSAGTQFQGGDAKYKVVGKLCDFRLKSLSISEMVR